MYLILVTQSDGRSAFVGEKSDAATIDLVPHSKMGEALRFDFMTDANIFALERGIKNFKIYQLICAPVSLGRTRNEGQSKPT